METSWSLFRDILARKGIKERTQPVLLYLSHTRSLVQPWTLSGSAIVAYLGFETCLPGALSSQKLTLCPRCRPCCQLENSPPTKIPGKMGTVRRSMPLRLLPAWLLVALPTVGAFLPSPPSLCRSRLPSTSCSPSSVSHHPRLPAPAPHRRAGLGGVRSTQALVLSGPVGAVRGPPPAQ